ncbi:Bug family tripartite tricarboxylate transporter substrate binding protein [Brevibacillus marinus]|uniref:Bug family tripartite tricarboxylate transporter substrate binding protein n=1 Tax=Brevibacillus marinus TaxID=2496837 RepID=UPI0013DF9461|nr:tripartite tricarboxylate transporter substrate binding protein [Brevibacillus marinus]
MKKLVSLVTAIFMLAAVGCSQNAAPAPAGQTAAGDQGSQTKIDYPTKPIEIIVPYAPGGGTDAAARILANAVSKHLPNGQSMVVSNKPGGAATIGMTEVFKAKPDGYTIGMTTTGATSIQPHYGKSPYTHDSFQAVIRVLSVPQVLVVRTDAPWKTFEEWLEYVKANPDKFTYGTAGAGHTAHIAMEALNMAAGIKTKHVPFDGAGPAVTALVGGHVEGAVVQVQEAKAQIDAGKIRALVNVGSNKIESYKDVPLATEKGYDVQVDVYTGVLAPKDTPPEIVSILHDAFKKALEEPEVIEQFKKIGVEPAYAGPEEFQKDITDSFNRNGEIMKKVGLLQ